MTKEKPIAGKQTDKTEVTKIESEVEKNNFLEGVECRSIDKSSVSGDAKYKVT